MCLLSTPLISPFIIWLAKMLILLREIHFSFLAVFQDPAQLVHSIVQKMQPGMFHCNGGEDYDQIDHLQPWVALGS